ncbi:vWA domain-containing protein [Tepidamorphus sp. 3E244]|uniref:vWA domain-containing protein n=1 Tax=Tepidamorphus sp. 3E244 TaxID=3385498 RepID=UPI0038FC06EF
MRSTAAARLKNMGVAWMANERGAAAIIFALVLPILAMIIGVGIDYGRASKARTVAANTLDAVLLAVGRDLSIGTVTAKDAPARVKTLFGELAAETSLNQTVITAINTTADDANGLLKATVKGDSHAAFGGLFGINDVAFNVDASVNYNMLTVELSMVLDVTGSMSGSKIADLKTAAKDLIELLMPDDGVGTDKVRIALAPYANSVNVGDYAYVATGNKNTPCVIERDNKGKFDDKPPSVAPFSVTWSCPGSKIQPLTNSRKTLVDQINDYGASGMTAGHIGIAWGWYMLSPEWSAVWPTKSKPEPYKTANLLKVLIVMTDGEFNTWYVNNGSSTKQAEKLCKRAKKEDIVVYAVAFKAPPTAQTLLKDCATTSTDHYFNATTGEALKDAFGAIAIQIRNLRLTS